MAAMKKLGLIGYPLSHSFSKNYFSEKFLKENIKNIGYELFPLQNIALFPELLAAHADLIGLNVTIPYKEKIISYLDEIDPIAQHIGAVNMITIEHKKNKGYNSDYSAFKDSLSNWMQENFLPALVLGNGGASKAVQAALQFLKIPYLVISRQGTALGYNDITPAMLEHYRLIINTTPLGMYPEVKTLPTLPYQALHAGHWLYDLVYNPVETKFLQMARQKGSHTKNGLEMLYLQAEIAWSLWKTYL